MHIKIKPSRKKNCKPTGWKSHPLLPYKKCGFAVLLLFLSTRLFCISLYTSWVTKPKLFKNSDCVVSWGSTGLKGWCSGEECAEVASNDSSETDETDTEVGRDTLHYITIIFKNQPKIAKNSHILLPGSTKIVT